MRTWNVRRMMCPWLSLALLGFSPFLFSQSTGTASSAATAALPAYGGCSAPAKEGAKFCAPYANSSINAPFQVIASGTSGRGQVKLMELWADGKKVTQTNGTPFDEPVTLPAGTHELTVIELDTTGAFAKSARLTVSVEGNNGDTCNLPGGPGVNVCEPIRDSCHTSSWVTVLAAAKGRSGTVSRMELWVNGGKIANFPGDRINTNLFIQDFSTVTIYEVDSKGGFIKSASIVIQSC
jgi:Big-like domain-containing protein